MRTNVALSSTTCSLHFQGEKSFQIYPTTTKLQNTSHQTHTTIHRKFTLTLNLPSLQNKTTDVVIQQHSRKLLKMDILMSETCWAHNKWNKIASDIKLVFHSSTLIRVACMFLSNTTYFYLMVEVYLHYYLRYNYMFRLLTIVIFRLYMNP